MKKYFLIAGMAMLCLSFTSTDSEKVNNGKIVFESNLDGNFELYSIQNNGTDLQRLTSNLEIDAHPCFSFDGKHIVYSSQRNGKFDIFMIPTEGGEPIQITKHTGTNMVPCFAPDGKSILYESDADGNFEIYSIGIDGTNRKQLTYTEATIQNFGPKYSTDGKHIAFASNRNSNDPKKSDLYVMNSKGEAIVQLTNGMDNAESRSWSPNGKEIVFNAVIDGVGQLFLIEIATKKLKQLTQSVGNPKPFAPGGVFPVIRGEVTPHWTPDGKKIIFASDRNNHYDLYQMNPDGSEITRLTSMDYFSLSPNCQPIYN